MLPIYYFKSASRQPESNITGMQPSFIVNDFSPVQYDKSIAMQTENFILNLEKHLSLQKYVRLLFIFVIALENNGTPDTDLSTWIRLILGGIIHFRNINKLYFWKLR